MAGGAGAYFAATIEPTYAIMAILCGGMIACFPFWRRFIFIRAIILFVFGFLYAALYTWVIATPQIKRTMHNADVIGTVTNIDHTPDDARVYINTDQMRVRLKCDTPCMVQIGDEIRANANMYRPSPAYAPETFDYARWAYFNNLTATGYMTDYTVIKHGTPNINSVRDYIHKKSNSFLTDGLVLGYKNALDKQHREIWTTNGIAHVWSISGFHMTLVMGWLFAVFYFIFRCIPPLVRRVPARIPAMLCASIGLAAYLAISGGGIATLRAFMMAMLMVGAFVIGRSVISMRNICIVFGALVIVNPYNVMLPGFQLSFAAVFGLIWFWGNRRYVKRGFLRKMLFVLYAAIMTSVVATIFTAPFVAAHFGTLQLYGLVGNLLLVPVFSIAIMPLTVIGTVAAVAGWRGPIELAHAIYDYAFTVAEKIAGLPHADIIMPHIPNAEIVVIIIGFLCVMFIQARRAKYMIGATFITAGIIITTLTPKPVFFATYDHELIGFVEKAEIKFNKSRASNHFFAFATWKQRMGHSVNTPNTRLKHNNGLYILKSENFTVAYVQKFVPLSREIAGLCRDNNIDYIVSYFDVRAPRCEHKILRGGVVIYPSGRIQQTPHGRPWHNQRA